jgi:hypothetical protein
VKPKLMSIHLVFRLTNEPGEENGCQCQTSKNNDLLHQPAETKYNNHRRQSRLILRSRIFMRVHMTYKKMQLLPDLNNQITGSQFLTQGYHHTSTAHHSWQVFESVHLTNIDFSLPEPEF